MKYMIKKLHKKIGWQLVTNKKREVMKFDTKEKAHDVILKMFWLGQKVMIVNTDGKIVWERGK